MKKASRSDSLVKKLRKTQGQLEEEIELKRLLALKESLTMEKEQTKCYSSEPVYSSTAKGSN